MPAPALTETTIRYLFATDWLPSDPGEQLVSVPGGSTTGLDTAANLLQSAMWNLRRQGGLEFEQLRAVEEEPVTVLGGRSFASFALLIPDARLRGLEGALLNAARSVAPAEGLVERAFDRASGEHERGVRMLVRALDLDNRSPWGTVCSHCLGEAAAAGLVEVRGRLFKKIAISDAAAVASLRDRHAELRAARAADLDAEPELTGAVMGDCLKAVWSGYSPSLGD